MDHFLEGRGLASLFMYAGDSNMARNSRKRELGDVDSFEFLPNGAANWNSRHIEISEGQQALRTAGLGTGATVVGGL
jgi:hypothetical protein